MHENISNWRVLIFIIFPFQTGHLNLSFDEILTFEPDEMNTNSNLAIVY